MNKFLLTIFTIVSLLAVRANAQQTKGSVSGRLLDATNSQPLPFATVSVIKKADNTAAKSIQTDMQGNFKLDGIADGLYLLKATYVGYTTYTKDSISINPKKRIFVFNAIKMKETKGILKEVTVRAQRSTIQLGVDKKVFNVDQSLVSTGGSATDLLSNVPSVQVDADGNLNLRGSSNVRVLINGKPSALTGSSITDILQSIPASSIENIEVITNPSSKYDAEGQSGIINIVLKKNAQLGTNGSASASVGTQNTYNANMALAYQTKSVNIYGNYSYRKADRVGNGSTEKETFVTDPLFQNQIADQTFKFQSHNVRLGIDINLDPKTTLSFSGNGNFRNRDRYQDGNTILSTQSQLLQTALQNNKSISHGDNNLDFNTDFDHKYKKQGEELTANIGYSSGRDNSNDLLNTFYTGYTNPTTPTYRNYLQTNLNNGKEYHINLQADYTLPLSHNNRIEAGYRSTISQTDNANVVDTALASSAFVPDPDLTNHFLYQEQIHAIYGTYQQQFGKFGLQVGMRAEDAIIHTLLRDNGERHNQDYFRVYPSIFLSDKLSDVQTLQLSYTRRVSRPRDRQISPFLDKSDPFNWQEGNPNLKPEDTHSFELSYINYWKTVTLTSSVYYRITYDNIQQIRTPQTDLITLLDFENISNSQNGGFELIGKVNVTQTIDLTANANVYYRYLPAVPSLNLLQSSGFAWNGNLTANFKPVKKLGIQLRGDYQAPQVISQGRQRVMAGMDGAVKYDLTKKLNLSANVRDIFNSRKFGSITDLYTGGALYQHSESTRRFQTRTMLLTLAYRFGSTPDQKKDKKNKKDQNNPDDIGNPDDPTGGNGNPPAGGTGTGNGVVGGPQKINN